MRLNASISLYLILLPAIGAALLPDRASGQQPVPLTNAERVIGGVYDRSHDYDIVHQRIELSNFDWDSTSFRGRVATTLVARRPGLDSLILDAGHLLRIRTVVSKQGASLRYRTHGDTLVIFPARPAGFGDTLRFTIAYDGKVQNGRGLTYIKRAAQSNCAAGYTPCETPQQLWSQGEAMDNHRWFPTYDFPNDKMTWELSATVPSGFTAVSNGKLVADTKNANGTRTMVWSETHPNASYLVSLVIAPLVKIHDAWKTVPVDYYVYRQDSARAWPLFHITTDMIDVYSRLTGIPYPWEKYAQTTVADFFGGMENVSATTLVDWLPDANAYQDRPWFQYILIPHELAHQWFGDYVTTHDWSNSWLNEGFAEYLPGQYWLAKHGTHLEQDYYLDEYRQFMGTDARRRMPIAADNSNNIYPKGALVLQMMKHYLGEERFWAGIHRYLTENAKGTANTDDLRQAIQRATGEDLAWFFNQWIYSAGYPEFDVVSAYDAATHRLTLTVKQTQQDTSKADSTGLRYVTPAVFRMPVEVRVASASGDVTRKFWLNQRAETLVIDSVAEPTMIVFDPANYILKKVTFNQTTPMLAEMLRRSDDLWTRQWAIDQLAKRKDDASAAAALSGAATGADYFLTRQAATTALGGFDAATALPALNQAARDTSSQVRRAAANALVTFGAAAVATLKQLYEHDRSYTVRASALGGLTRADSANAGGYIRAGIAQESYRGEIKGAAMNAIARTADTTFISDAESTLRSPGASAGSAFALAAMIRRGNTRALDVLINGLNGPLAGTRRWSGFALGQVITVAGVRERLQAALPALQFADARTNVEQMLAAPPR